MLSSSESGSSKRSLYRPKDTGRRLLQHRCMHELAVLAVSSSWNPSAEVAPGKTRVEEFQILRLDQGLLGKVVQLV